MRVYIYDKISIKFLLHKKEMHIYIYIYLYIVNISSNHLFTNYLNFIVEILNSRKLYPPSCISHYSLYIRKRISKVIDIKRSFHMHSRMHRSSLLPWNDEGSKKEITLSRVSLCGKKSCMCESLNSASRSGSCHPWIKVYSARERERERVRRNACSYSARIELALAPGRACSDIDATD